MARLPGHRGWCSESPATISRLSCAWNSAVETLQSSAILIFCLAFYCHSSALAVSPTSTLLLFNANDPDSVAIKDHYMQAHPGVRSFGLDLNGFGEEITGQQYLDEIRQPLIDHLGAGSLGDDIDTIVTAKGLPLRINAGSKPADSDAVDWQKYSSLESELTRAESISTIEQLGNQDWTLAQVNIPNIQSANPYYLGLEFGFPTPDPIPYSGPVGFDRSDSLYEGIRLTSRLDGFSREDVVAMIDRSQSVYLVPHGHYVAVDDDPDAFAAGETAMSELAQTILPSHAQLAGYDTTDEAITYEEGPVIGYVSHGTKDRAGGLETGYILNQLNFQLAPGAVFHSYESFNAISFDPSFTQTQGLVAEWIAIGGTAGLGHVSEPDASKWTVTNEDIFYDMLLSEFTFAEAAWAATRQLSYVNTMIGDPLMTWRKWIPGDTNLDGTVEFNDFYTLQGNWEMQGDFSEGDLNGDGIIDSADLEILQENWLMTDESQVQPLSEGNIFVEPVFDEEAGLPKLIAFSLQATNLDGDIDVDGDDLQILMNSYGSDAGGDVDGDGDTDGMDFLQWQRDFAPYDVTADFDIDAQVDAGDAEIWGNSYATNRGGDADGDGDTDGHDFLAWQRETSVKSSHISASLTHVPEPASSFLCCLGALALAFSPAANRCRRTFAR